MNQMNEAKGDCIAFLMQSQINIPATRNMALFMIDLLDNEAERVARDGRREGEAYICHQMINIIKKAIK